MLYSEDRKFVLVAVPKTGTTSLQTRLCAIDPTIERNRVLSAEGTPVKLRTHSTAAEIRAAIGPRADEFTFVAFLRDPRDVMLSKYHFYRTGRAAKKHGLSGDERPAGTRRNPATLLKVLSAQVLPLELWAQLYPSRPSSGYVTDARGALIVDRVGMFERLQDDVTAIFTGLGYDPADLQLGLENRTGYSRDIRAEARLDAIVASRLATDRALYDRLRALPPGCAVRGSGELVDV